MSEHNTEDIIGALYDMVQDARSMPLAADKCILERDKVLDMLDEIIAQLPAELKQSRAIVESRNELIGQARREAEGIVREAFAVSAASFSAFLRSSSALYAFVLRVESFVTMSLSTEQLTFSSICFLITAVSATFAT